MTDENHVIHDNIDRRIRPDNKKVRHNQQNMRSGKDADTNPTDQR